MQNVAPTCYSSLSYTTLFRSLHATIQGHADLPWTGKHLRILNRSFVHERICAARRVAFHDMQSVAMKITCAIEPGLVVQAGEDRKSTRLNSSHRTISYDVFCL